MLATLSSSATETTVNFAPDDSDLLDFSLPAAAHKELPKQLLPPAPPRPAARLAHGLIPVSNRFWFGVFPHETLPSAESLNASNGLTYAKFPSDLPSGARPSKVHWFCIDEDLVYLSFSNDWGPLNIAMFYRFCVHVHQMLIDDEMASMHLCLYTSTDAHYKANAALLCALYAMTIDHISPADAFFPYSEMELMPFRDAGYGRADFSLTMQDILYGMRRALDNNLLDLTTFDLEEYEHYEQVQHGDWNWITPQFLAFASPKDRTYMAMLAASGGQPCAVPYTTAKPTGLLRSTVDYFVERKIGLVVRLNNPLYNRTAFTQAGLEHKDMYFDDGSNPSDEIVQAFIADADRIIQSGHAVAVHCKAGLGRTGVLIGAYLIWKYQFTASEVIGYMRMMRPGCVVGPQQHYMYERAGTWMRWGVEHRLRIELQGAVPQTPSAKRTQDATHTPHTAPAVKPTPCVGQPRKSPSPKRRRVGLLGSSTSSEGSQDERSRVVSDERDATTVEKLVEQQTDEEVLGVLPPKASATEIAAENARRMAQATHTPRAAERPLDATSPRPVDSTRATRADSPGRTTPRVRRAMAPAQPTQSPAPRLKSPVRTAPRSGENVPPPPRRFVARPRP